MKLLGSHAACNGLREILRGMRVELCMVGYFPVYEIWLSMLFGSFLCMLRVMVVFFFPVSSVIASRSVVVICR